MDFHSVQDLAARFFHVIMTSFEKVPGSAILVRYVQSRYQTDPVPFIIEITLALFFIHYVNAKKKGSREADAVRLTEKEIDELVEDWTPEPLLEELTPLEIATLKSQPVITGPPGSKCKLTSGRTVINLTSSNFYDFASDAKVKENAIAALRKYGVGPCSAPNFYGTQDIHFETEAKIASFIGTESCIIYSQAFVTASSMIPSFAKRGDIIVADEACNYSIRKGLQLARTKIYWYKHNDMEDLENTLKRIIDDSRNKTLTRRFIATEGMFENIGDVVDLPKIIELKSKYKFRLILDETWSIGVLGRTGRGVTEAQHVDVSQVDLLSGSLSGPLSGGGGFCASSRDVVEHQRINSAAYCYSCALPAILAASASTAIDLLQTNPGIMTTCRENITVLRTELSKCQWLQSTSVPQNPVQIFILTPQIVAIQAWSMEEQEQLLQDCVDECLTSNILITRLKSMPVMQGITQRERGWAARPAIKACVTTGLDKQDIKKAGTLIRQAFGKILTKRIASKANLLHA